AAVIGASSQFHIRAYPIELHKPMFKTRSHVKLPASNLIGLRIPGDDCFGSSSSRGGADLNDVCESSFCFPIEGKTALHQTARFFDERLRRDWRGALF